METIGKRIEAARAAKGWSQKRLSEELLCKPEQISMWENSRRIPRADAVKRLANALEVRYAWLMYGQDPMSEGGAAENVIPYRADAINAEILSQALSLVLQELQNRKATLPPSKIAAAVVEIYELVTSQGKKEVAADNVTPFVRLLLAR